MPDDLQQRVLDAIQSNFPVASDPWVHLGRRLGAPREDVMRAVEALYGSGVVRRIGASFDSRKVGYTSTLCAMSVPGGEERLAEVAAIVGSHPQVTHNYGRANRYNLWFTLITRDGAQKTAILNDIRAHSGIGEILDLPATRTFKIKVDFSAMGGGAGVPTDEAAVDEVARTVETGEPVPDAPAEPALSSAVPDVPANCQAPEGAGGCGSCARRSTPHCVRAAEPVPFDPENPVDVAVLRWAQGDIARDGDGRLLDAPYAAGTAAVNGMLAAAGLPTIDEAALRLRLRQMRAVGAARRIGAIVRHQRIGMAANSMTAWDVTPDQVERAGALFAEAPFVTHCYERPRSEAWPANLYAMCHARCELELSACIADLAGRLDDAGITCHASYSLPSTHEFKKTSMRYYEEVN